MALNFKVPRQARNRYMNSSNVAKALFGGSKNILIKKCQIISLTFSLHDRKCPQVTPYALGESKYR